MNTPDEKLLKVQRIHAYSLLLAVAETKLIARLNEGYMTTERIVSHRLLTDADAAIHRLQKQRDYLDGAMHLLAKARQDS